jgi:oxepin-CoA hydrolase/3-oxo-5,6-dehydrosuberyl-CoA semialdehyde dehydrogenase
VDSYVGGRWVSPSDEGAPVLHAATGEVVAHVSQQPVAAAEALAYGRAHGAALRELTFHERAAILKQVGSYLMDRKEELYELSYATGATLRDSAIDVDGGFGTLLSYASKGRRELPAGSVYAEGLVEPLGRGGTFVAQHIYTPLQGVAMQVNAYNFPVWGMLEKLAPAFLAGVPSVVKPASQTAYVTEACVRQIVESGLLPDGALQLLIGGTDGLLDGLTGQDLLSFTGSAATAAKLRAHPSVVQHAVRFNGEADSLNACVLGLDGKPGTEEFDLFVREVVREMTAKAGQKCTAIRRAFVPREFLPDVTEALHAKLSAVTVGDPRDPDTRMGPLVSTGQAADVRKAIGRIGGETILAGSGEGAFLSPVLLRHDDSSVDAVHDVEAFGPVSTLLPYDRVEEVPGLLARGQGSLVATVVSHDTELVRSVVLGAAAFHGRIHILDRDNAKESTGHGSPLPVLVHGGPGRAGGGEELGGIRGVLHHMQRTAVQATPAALQAITGSYVRGAARVEDGVHPFRKSLHELQVGDTVVTGTREVTLADVDHFAEFTGDTFYAHTDPEAAAANPLFGGIVAHGYLILSLAAGLFVDPTPGPVLANTGLDRLRFTMPVKPGDTIRAVLTCASKTPRNDEQGEVRWDVQVLNQDDTVVASYELLTMVAA